MAWLKRAFPLIPSAICFLYAATVAIESFYVGLIAEPNALESYAFGRGAEEWHLRSRGHYFWYGATVSSVFVAVGFLLKRLLSK
jgi:hypothetical protein